MEWLSRGKSVLHKGMCSWCANNGKASLAERISEERVGAKGGQMDVAVGIDSIEGSVWAMEKIQNSTEYMWSNGKILSSAKISSAMIFFNFNFFFYYF